MIFSECCGSFVLRVFARLVRLLWLLLSTMLALLLLVLLLQAWFTPKCKEIQDFQHRQELRKKQRRAQKAVRTGVGRLCMLRNAG